ncbi:MFS transporter [Catenuloplanes japonicus]|uniref:MFS transporter n=1 Tax=Catenuloplanes japonicus TaxID=33876 RepID=UPI0007C5C1A5|nr:MFS transporter [Catenuloplanes japonicus]
MLTPLRERNYRLWAASDLVSVGGTWMQVLGLNWLVLSATGSAAATGVIVLLQSAPVLILGSWGGALADRLPARPVLLTSQAVRALLSLLLVAAAGAGALWPIYLVALLSGVISAIEVPVLGRFGSALVSRDALAPAIALGSVLGSAGRILGMALGGVLIGLAGPGVLFAINAASFGAVILALALIRPAEMYPLARASSTGGGVLSGLRYLATQPVVLVVMVLAFVIGGLGRNYQVTMAAMVAGPLGGGAGGYGIVSTVFAAGAVLGGLLVAGTGRAGYRVLAGAAALISTLQLLSAAAPGLLTFALLILPIAAGAVVFDTVVGTRVMLDTREDMRGRVLASLALVSSLAGIVGAPTLGRLADTIGARGALAVAGVITTAAALIGALVLARLSRAAGPVAPVVPAQRPSTAPAGSRIVFPPPGEARRALPAAHGPLAPHGPLASHGAPAPHGSTHPGPSRPGAFVRPPGTAHVTEQPARGRRTLISLGTGRRGRAVTAAAGRLDRPAVHR